MVSAFCSRVKELRLQTGLSRKEFAESIGEYPNTYSAWENASMAGSCSIPKLALCLGTTTDYLFGLTDDPKPPAAQPEGQMVLAGWMPGGTNPGAEPGWCVCLMSAYGDDPRPKAMWWNGHEWLFAPEGVSASLDPVGWMRLPEYEKEDAETC